MSIARITPIVGSLYALMRQALGLNVATPLGAQELSCTVAPDRRLVVLGHEPIAGFERTHGTVADEAAMLALHTLDSTTLSISPRFVAPGDSVLRTDDPGWRWHCISGHGQSLSDWERRPLGGALSGLSAEIAGAQPLDADLTAVAAQGLSTWGLAWIALAGNTAAKNTLGIEQADVSGLVAELAAKWPTPANAAVLALLTDSSGSLAYNGSVVGGSGGGGAAAGLLPRLRSLPVPVASLVGRTYVSPYLREMAQCVEVSAGVYGYAFAWLELSYSNEVGCPSGGYQIPTAIANGSFETPALASGVRYGPTAYVYPEWTWHGATTHQGSAVSNPYSPPSTAVSGSTFAMVQTSSTALLFQWLHLTAGSHTLTWSAARRANYSANVTYRAFIGDTFGSNITLSSSTWATQTLTVSVAADGVYAVGWQIIADSTSDRTMFLDAVSIASSG